MVGPSDLDTDTRFNNVICGALWDGLLEHKVNELAPALHYGKSAVLNEFKDLMVADVTTTPAARDQNISFNKSDAINGLL